jgi:hypothetical protein
MSRSKPVCVRCGATIVGTATYRYDEGPICARCLLWPSRSDGFVRLYQFMGAGSLVMATLSAIANPGWVLTTSAFVGSLATWIYPLLLEPEDREDVRRCRWPRWVALVAVALAAALVS